MNRPFASLVIASLAALALGTAACSRQVESGPGSHHDDINGNGGSDTTTDTCGEPPGASSNAIAISLGSLQMIENDGSGGSTGSSGSGGGGPSPSTIVLQASNRSYTCSAPELSWDCANGTTWELSVELQPAQLAPGTFDLSDPSLNAFYSISGSNGGAGDCWGGGGSALQGKLVIESVEDTAVHFRFVGTNGNDDIDGLASDGMYVAPRCQ